MNNDCKNCKYPFYKEAYQTGFEEGQDRVIKLFNKYDVLLVHVDGKIVPVKNTSKQDCYNLLYEIQELINWRRILFKKYLEEVERGKEK